MPRNIRERRVSSDSEENSDKETEEEKKKEPNEDDQPKNVKYIQKIL